MYSTDGNDRVIELADLPQCDTGTPLPTVIATDHQIYLMYYLKHTPAPGWDGTWVQEVDSHTSGNLAIISFERCHTHMFGWPNDEILHAHPLAKLGLRHYGIFRVENSSWIRALEKMNSIHPMHRPGMLLSLSHFIFAFHDSTFECIAESYQVQIKDGSIKDGLKCVFAALQ